MFLMGYRPNCWRKLALLLVMSGTGYLLLFYRLNQILPRIDVSENGEIHESNILNSENTETLATKHQHVFEFSKKSNSNRMYTDWFQNKATLWFRHVVLAGSLSEFRKWAIGHQRQAIAEELTTYKLSPPDGRTWKALIPEDGGKPIRNVVFTTWRSGSTFLEEILNSHPGTFYHYEPLQSFEIVQVRDGDLAKKAIKMIRNVLNCNFTLEQIKYGEDHFGFHTHNTRVAQYCQYNHKICFDPKFQSAMCQLFPFQALKTVRIRLKLGKYLLDDPRLDIRLLYLVRDPRGTLQSRRHRDWCPGEPDCDSPRVLCNDLADDFYAAEKLRQEYPQRIMLLRYEDFALNIYDAVIRIFKFFRLHYNAQVKDFLSGHTTTDVVGLYSTRRNSKTTPFHWIQDFQNNFKEVRRIQSECKIAMKLWGYKIAEEPALILSFNPIGSPPWVDMEFPAQNKTTSA